MVAMDTAHTPTIAILGTGYVGLTTAALFAAAGMKTYVVDPNPSRLESVRQGRSFFFEEGLDPVIAEVVRKGMLIATDSYAEAVPHSDVIISSVGTPDNPDGSSNLSYIFAAATEAAKYMQPSAVYVQKSTVPVGTGARVMQLFAEAGITNSYVSNPEFLRESTALRDSLWFDRVVVGGDDMAALERVMDVYRFVESQRDAIAAIAGIAPPADQQSGRYITTSLASAEMIKVVSNAFLALKISFANSVALLADKADADVLEVMDAVGADKRIGRAFLNAGRGYGGGCFPKDVSGLIASGLDLGVDLEIMQATQAINEQMPKYIINKMQAALGGVLEGRKVAVLGLSFKPGTSDARRSAGVAMANVLFAAGAKVAAYDPQAHEEAMHFLDHSDILVDGIEAAITDADAVIVATDWQEFVSFTPAAYAEAMAGKVFVDAMNRFDPAAIREAGLTYVGVGRGKQQ
jgi:UDPglucose 6-dehydrogenase